MAIVLALLVVVSWISLALVHREDLSDLIAFPIALLGAAIMFYDSIMEIRKGNLSIDLLACIAVISAMLIHEFLPAAIVVVMLLGGQAIEEYASGRASRAIDSLVKIRPKTARVLRADQISEVAVDELIVGDVVIVSPGDRIPVDGVVINGSATVDEASITGESLPLEKSVNTTVLSGTICQNGQLEIKATKVGEDTKFAHIIKLVREAQGSKARIQRVADRYAKLFTPLILGLALLTYVITGQPIRSVTILLAASPCPLLLATPVAVVSAIGKAARLGILVRSGASMETAGSVNAVVFDKTGTLTDGRLRVTRVQPFNGPAASEVIRYAALAEKLSNHPIAKAITDYATEQGIVVDKPSEFREIVGSGVIAKNNGERISLGNARFMESQLIHLSKEVERFMIESLNRPETTLLVARNSTVFGALCLADVLKPNAKFAIDRLRTAGIAKISILTGDSKMAGEAVGRELGVDANCEVLPDEKAMFIQALKRAENRVAMVGDGINDAPALATADVGIAMGAAGSDVAIETADVTIMADDLVKVSEAITLSRNMLRIAKQSLLVGILANVLGVTLSAFGILNPVLGATFHECADLFVILNSARAFTTRV